MPSDLSVERNLPDKAAAAMRLRAAQDARRRGELGAARGHLFEALEFHPSAPAVLAEMALACADDADLVALWTERLVRATTDAQGRARLDGELRKALDATRGLDALLKPAAELAAVRAAAAAELARFAERQKPAPRANGARALLVRWAAELLLEIAEGAPFLLETHGPAVAKVQGAFQPDYDLVFQALGRLLGKRAAAGPTTGKDNDDEARLDRRLRAARIVAGLARQAQQKDLKGPPAPGFGGLAAEALRVIGECQAPAALGRVWSIAELEAMDAEERVRFSAAHRHWRRPAVALSTSGRYRIETICGHETLLGAAKTVELHHARLVDHFGSDPFTDRQGTIRIVPEPGDLESEGAPYWWAAGFQRGDLTVVRFAWGTIPALGRTLTHELTHRFDGVLRPFLGAWYGEGHADWTAGHYSRMADPRCLEDYLDRGTVAHTFYKGYGRRDKFELLLRGELDDYRDNYFAGYSLYAFLRQYPPDQPRYRAALNTYERQARAGQKDPVGYFTATFADGKQGRPATFDELCGDWERFLRGCYDWLDERSRGPDNAWVGSYAGRGKGDGGSLVMDEPTWTWTRRGAEPFFGQGHAADAALLLAAAGETEAAIAAGVWSLTVDGWRPDIAAGLLAWLRAARSVAAAEAFAVTAGRRFPDLLPGDTPQLLAALPKTQQLLDTLAAHSEALERAAAPLSAAATRAERARLAGSFALAAGDVAAGPPALPRHLGGHGWAESSLVDFDERRAAGLWFATADGDLHVGRERPRESTGVLDRRAHQRDAFAHSTAWLAAGDYVLRGRIHFTTSFVSGAIVFGQTRRDRGLRLSFSSGDFDYATGRSEQNERRGRVQLRLDGLWERDHHLPESRPAYTVELPDGRDWFDWSLTVRGPRVVVAIDGEVLLRYAVHDGTPIEGQVGFATSMGAIRVQLPTAQRLDRGGAVAVHGLDVARQPAAALDDLMLLPTRGIPRHEQGTMVLWMPRITDGSPLQGIDRALRLLQRLLDRPHEHPQLWVLALPRDLAPAERQQAMEAVMDIRAAGMPVVEHAVGAPLDGDDAWLLFVDALGVLRAAARIGDPKLHSRVERWSRLFRPR